MMRKEEIGALTTIIEFVCQVVKENNHFRALSDMDLSDDGFIDDLETLNAFELNPMLREALVKSGILIEER